MLNQRNIMIYGGVDYNNIKICKNNKKSCSDYINNNINKKLNFVIEQFHLKSRHFILNEMKHLKRKFRKKEELIE